MKRNLLIASAFVGSTVASVAAPIAVDLGDATTSVTNAGTALIGIAVVMLAIGLVYGFLRRK